MSVPTPATAFERELRSILIRHLPVGLEGIGTAQAAAVVNLLKRTRDRTPVDPDTRTGLRLLKDAADTHAASVRITETGAVVCGLCRTPSGDSQPWPCQVRLAGQYLKVTDEPPGTTAVVG